MEIKESQDYFSTKRPDPAPGQVRKSGDFKPGKKYDLFFDGVLKGNFIVLTPPYSKNEDFDLWIRVRANRAKDGQEQEMEMSMFDLGVQSDKDGNWNIMQYAVDPEEAKKPKVVDLQKYREKKNKIGS